MYRIHQVQQTIHRFQWKWLNENSSISTPRSTRPRAQAWRAGGSSGPPARISPAPLEGGIWQSERSINRRHVYTHQTASTGERSINRRHVYTTKITVMYVRNSDLVSALAVCIYILNSKFNIISYKIQHFKCKSPPRACSRSQRPAPAGSAEFILF